MKERILNYRKRIDACLSGDIQVEDWNKVLDEHLIQIGFFHQIHLRSLTLRQKHRDIVRRAAL